MAAETGTRAKDSAEQAEAVAERGAEKAAANPALEWAARGGWIVKGLLYLTMGGLAMGLAIGVSGATDQRGILRLLTKDGGPWGNALVIAIALALGAHALWNFFNAVLDPLRGRDEPKGWGRRLAFAGRGVAYSMLLVFCAQLISGRPGSDSDSIVPRAAASALDHPFGPAITVLGGLVAFGVGIVLLVQAARGSSAKKDMRREEMSDAERKTTTLLGRLGSAAYGLVSMVIGWFVVQAALFHDPKQAKGIVGAFGALAEQPAGRVLLGLIAVCFIGLGFYGLAAARWMRMPGSAR
jgi:Domain of Unknown Function (DUF1206)